MFRSVLQCGSNLLQFERDVERKLLNNFSSVYLFISQDILKYNIILQISLEFREDGK